jgi:hypothetical protein
MSQFEKPAVTVPGTGDTSLATIRPEGRTLLCMHVAVATQALDNFDVKGRSHDSASMQDFTPANWASLTAGHRVRRASGNLAAQAAGSEGYFEMDVSGLKELEILASGAADSAAVTLRWSLT